MGTIKSSGRSNSVRIIVIAAAAIVLLVAPLVLPAFANQTLVRVGVYAVAVLGLNIIMGYTGQVNLGQIFFVGLGAYVTAYGVNHGWNIVLVFVAACFVAGAVGLLVALAAARLGGLAIAMVTIALPIVGVPLAKRLNEFTGGSQGVSARFSAAPEWSGLYNDQWQFYIVLLVTAVAFLLARNLVRGKYGRAFTVVRENEAVAASMGVSPYRTKVLAFTVASIFGGVSGFLYMAAVQYTSPETLSFGHSIGLLAAMVIGGAGSITGSLIGGAYYVFVPQLTNAIDPSFTTLSQGAILLLVLFLLPQGLVSLPRVVRRLTRRRTSRPTLPGDPPHTSPAPHPVTEAARKGFDKTERQDQS
ncbi:MAG: branched-chain amino acid transporter permease [Pseudarthrobacter sp.]|nr:branched-chain amino acid transporter permease [Pseudarthrobacter sp.]